MKSRFRMVFVALTVVGLIWQVPIGTASHDEPPAAVPASTVDLPNYVQLALWLYSHGQVEAAQGVFDAGEYAASEGLATWFFTYLPGFHIGWWVWIPGEGPPSLIYGPGTPMNPPPPGPEEIAIDYKWTGTQWIPWPPAS